MVPHLRVRAVERRLRGVAGRLGSPVATVASLLVAVLAAAAVAGCGGSSRPRSAAATEAARKRALSLSVVAIEARIGTDLVRSSGAVIAGPRGLVLTSAHSVWGATSLRVLTGVGLVHGRVVARGAVRRPCAARDAAAGAGSRQRGERCRRPVVGGAADRGGASCDRG